MYKFGWILFLIICSMLFYGCTEKESEKVESISEENVIITDEETSSGEIELMSNVETQSEEVAEEIVGYEEDYSVDSIMGKIDELIEKYPNDDPEQIKALVLGMNLEYMERADVEQIMTTYGYDYTTFCIYFVAALHMKYDLAVDRSVYLRGESEEYLLNRYESHVLLDECCLNSEDIEEYREFEDMMAFGELRDWSTYAQPYAENYNKEDKKAYIVIMIAMDPDSRNAIIEDFDQWENYIFLYSEQ